jgi:hypothetical protein
LNKPKEEVATTLKTAALQIEGAVFLLQKSVKNLLKRPRVWVINLHYMLGSFE